MLDVGMLGNKTIGFVFLTSEHLGDILSRDMILEHNGDCLGQGIEQSGDQSAFAIRGHEYLGYSAFRITIYRNVDFNIFYLSRMGATGTDSQGLVSLGDRLLKGILCFFGITQQFWVDQVFQFSFRHIVFQAGVQRLSEFGAVAIERNPLDPFAPGIDRHFLEVFHSGIFGQIDGFADRSGDKGRQGRHHEDMSVVVDKPGACSAGICRVKDCQMLFLQIRRSFDLSVQNHAVLFLGDIVKNCLGLFRRVAQIAQSFFDDRIGNRHIAAAGQLLVYHMGEERFDGGSCAIHREGNRSGRGDDRDLGIAVAVFCSQIQRADPFFLQRLG
ncbi:hypothetical protein DSECCO2_479130 [anaerobic digester metagenome]